jgi:hypothetical protein
MTMSQIFFLSMLTMEGIPEIIGVLGAQMLSITLLGHHSDL